MMVCRVLSAVCILLTRAACANIGLGNILRLSRTKSLTLRYAVNCTV